ncbi:C18orf8 family protein [Megaselia abdita]
MDSHYLELLDDHIRFVAVSSLTNVFFDESNKQIFAVRTGGGGTIGVNVKGPSKDSVINFFLDDTGTIRSIKFSPDNEILAVQRHEHSVEFILFKDTQQTNRNRGDIFRYNTKSSTIHGFVWVSKRECAVISNSSVELFTINAEKKQIKSLKSLNIGIKWFAWYSEGNMALVSTTDGALFPVLISQKVITKLPKLDIGSNVEVPERDVTLGQLYGTSAILILQQTSNRLVEIVVYLLNGAGLAPRKSHVIRLGSIGRFAINIIDNLIIVHHQTSQTSMLFDISLSKEVVNEITYHNAIIPGRSIKPFALKLPSLSLDEKSVNCELYSKNWVLFQPNIVIDAQLGCMWYLNLKLDPLTILIADKVRLTEFLLQRSEGKVVLLKVLKNLVTDPVNGSLLTSLESIFDRINSIYSSWNQYEVQSQTAQPINLKLNQKNILSPPKSKVIINQNDMCLQVFNNLEDKPQAEDILMVYLQSLSKHQISAQDEISKMISKELIRNENYKTLEMLVEFSLICETKVMACFLLSYSKLNPIINQTALDMLKKISANEIIVEVLLEIGHVIDALRIARTLPNSDNISARKYLEAAQKNGDPNIFHNVFKFFQQRNLKQRGKVDFLKQEQCNEFVEHYETLFNSLNC